MRFLSLLLLSTIIASALFWSWINFPEARNTIMNIFNYGKFQTLEIRYSADAVIDHNKQDLLQDDEHSFLEPQLHFHPYLMMKVKYNRTHDRTGEGVILWSLIDGEMVVNTKTWETTHGFVDCLEARADKDDFKIINALATHGGSLDRDSLFRVMNVENPILDIWLDRCRTKSLIVQTGNIYRLHIQNPHLQVAPETHFHQGLVSKTAKDAVRVPKRFSVSQIKNMAMSAFGKNNLSIRETKEIFLPVYSIVIQNPDGSQMTTFWNAMNGKRLPLNFHID